MSELKIYPNCYKIVKSIEKGNIAVGTLEHHYMVKGELGEIVYSDVEFSGIGLMWQLSSWKRKLADGDLVYVTEYDSPMFIHNKELETDTNVDYVFVKFEDLFPDKTVYPFITDKGEKEAKKQLFYYTFDEKNRDTYVDAKSNIFRSRFCLQASGLENVYRDNLEGLYIPFLNTHSRDGLVPIINIYWSMTSKIIRPLPVICGARYGRLPSDDCEKIGLICKNNKDINDLIKESEYEIVEDSFSIMDFRSSEEENGRQPYGWARLQWLLDDYPEEVYQE